MKKILVFCAAIALFAACNKKEEETPTKTRKEYLTGGKWFAVSNSTYIKITDASGETISLIDTTIYATQPCEVDNFVVFNSDGTAVGDEGALKCDSSMAQTSKGIWWFSNNDTRIFMGDEDSLGYNYVIKELNANVFTCGVDTTYSYLGSSYIYKTETKMKR